MPWIIILLRAKMSIFEFWDKNKAGKIISILETNNRTSINENEISLIILIYEMSHIFSSLMAAKQDSPPSLPVKCAFFKRKKMQLCH